MGGKGNKGAATAERNKSGKKQKKLLLIKSAYWYEGAW